MKLTNSSNGNDSLLFGRNSTRERTEVLTRKRRHYFVTSEASFDLVAFNLVSVNLDSQPAVYSTTLLYA